MQSERSPLAFRCKPVGRSSASLDEKGERHGLSASGAMIKDPAVSFIMSRPRIFAKQGSIITPAIEYPSNPHLVGTDREGHHHTPLEVRKPETWANVIPRHAALGERLQSLAKAANAAHIANCHLGPAVGVPYVGVEGG